MANAIVSATTLAAENPDIKSISRREFLNYLLGASTGMLLAEACGAVAWFALPRSRLPIPNNLFKIDPSMIPLPEATPNAFIFRQGPFWLVNTKRGLLAFICDCPHRADSLFKWVEVDNRYECPACGSQFRLDGTYISGPAVRNLDRYVIHVTTPKGIVSTPPVGSPVSIQGATAIVVDESKKILGQIHPV